MDQRVTWKRSYGYYVAILHFSSVLLVTVVNREWHATSGHGQTRI